MTFPQLLELLELPTQEPSREPSDTSSINTLLAEEASTASMLLCRLMSHLALYAAHVDIWQPGFNLVKTQPLVMDYSSPACSIEAIRQICSPSCVQLILKMLAESVCWDLPMPEAHTPSVCSRAAPEFTASTEPPPSKNSPCPDFAIHKLQKSWVAEGYRPAGMHLQKLQELWQAPLGLVLMSTLQQVLEVGAFINVHPKLSAGRFSAWQPVLGTLAKELLSALHSIYA
jgi:hypothetical protein